MSMDESEKLRLVETLKFQIDEIERAELQPGEEDELLERRKVLQNAEKLTDAMEAAVCALYGDETSDGAAAMIANAAHALERVSRVSDEMRQLSGKLNDLMYTAQDIADELRDKKDDLTYSADELEQIEERLDTLHKLKRKYGGSVEDVIAFCEKAKRPARRSRIRVRPHRAAPEKAVRTANSHAGKGHGTLCRAENGGRKITGGNFFRADAAGYAENSVCLRVFRAAAGRKTASTPSVS